jgi:CHAD domain-containing protein
MMEEHGDLANLMDNVRCDLDRGRQSADGLALDDDLGFELFGHGLAKTFRRARRRFTEAYSKRGRLVGDDDHFHEWRKRIKYHRYHARLLEPIWPEVVASHRDRCKLMTDQLGDDHDLVDLRRVIGRDHHFFRDQLDETAVHDLVRFSQERSRELRLMARSSGRAIFTEKPRALVKRFGGYWAAAQANR